MSISIGDPTFFPVGMGMQDVSVTYVKCGQLMMSFREDLETLTNMCLENNS